MPQPLLNQTREAPAFRWFFYALLAAFCLWVLHLPLFPMQDGPMHLYLAQVFGDLLSNPHSVYAPFYSIQHLLPPYSLHYYLLIFLMKLLPALWAEKVVICLILVCFCTGTRALAMASGPSGEVFALFSFAIALNWPLAMGFQNYILALGLACWALAVWSTPTPKPANRALFAGLCWLTAIAHPVPLLLILAFAAADLAFRAISSGVRKPWLQDAVAFACATTLVFYLRAFTDKQRSVQDFRAQETVRARAQFFMGLHGLDFFTRNSLAAHLLQLSLYLLLAVTLICAIRAYLRRESKHWLPAYTWLPLTLLFTAVLPFLPDDLSGSKAFASRLQIVTFIGCIAAASGLDDFSRRAGKALAALAIVIAIFTLALAQARLAPIAHRIFALDTLPLAPAGSRGLLLSAHAEDGAAFTTVTYEPLHWQAADYFRRSHAILLNTPWLDSTWLPITATSALLTRQFPPWTMECYHCLRQKLIDVPEARANVFARTDFIFFIDQPGTATQADLDAILKADPHFQWSCQHHDWLFACQKLR